MEGCARCARHDGQDNFSLQISEKLEEDLVGEILRVHTPRNALLKNYCDNFCNLLPGNEALARSQLVQRCVVAHVFLDPP